MSKIKVIIKRPEAKPYVTNISSTLKNLQATVGGYVEMVKIAADCAIICNEEGRIAELPYNCSVAGRDFFGTVIFAGVKRDGLDDIPIDFQGFKKMFGNLFE